MSAYDSIEQFIESGEVKLKDWVPVHPEVEKKLETARRARSADEESSVKFSMNATGNIFCTTTSGMENLSEEAKKYFDSVTVLFVAITKAMGEKKKSLFDYEALTQVVRQSGFFAEVQKYRKTLDIKAGSLSVDTQIIQQLLPAIKEGRAMEIAKGVLSGLNGEFKARAEDKTVQIGHILFICEEIFGSPSVCVRIFYASQESHQKIPSSPCHQSVSVSFQQLQEGNTFIYTDPDSVAKYAKTIQGAQNSDDFRELIDKLSSYID